MALLKQSAAAAEKFAAEEIISKFGVEYGQIQLSKVGKFVDSGKNL